MRTINFGNQLLFKLAVCASLIFCSASVARAGAKLTSDQVVKIASDFCQRINQPVTVAGTAQYQAASESSDEPKHHWQDSWKVSFPNQAEVEVVDATGVISAYTNSAFFLRKDNSPAGTALSQADAMQHANAALQAAGQIGEATFLQASLEQDHNPPLAASHQWQFLWRRTFKNVPYRNQHASVLLQAETGEVIELVLMFPSSPPEIASVSVRRNDSDATVQTLIKQTGITNAVLQDVQTEVVQPNTFWQPNGSVVPQPGAARTALAYRLQAADTTYEVWVDAQTGKVIGGEASGLLGRLGKAQQPVAQEPTTSLQAALNSAEKVLVYEPKPRGGWVETPLVSLSKQSHPEMFHLLKANHAFDGNGGLGLTFLKMVLIAPGQPPSELSYSPSGFLGRTGEWTSMPGNFIAWMQTLRSKATAQATK